MLTNLGEAVMGGHKCWCWCGLALVAIAALVILPGYFPGNWFLEHAKDDATKSDLIVVVRVVGLRQASEEILREKTPKGGWSNLVIRLYDADVLILAVIKPDTDPNSQIQAGSRLSMAVGADFDFGHADLLHIKPASPALTMHNSQSGYDLRIGQTYLLCLIRDKDGHWQPRSGPHSIFWAQPGDQYRQKGLRDYGEIQPGFKELMQKIRDQAAWLPATSIPGMPASE